MAGWLTVNKREFPALPAFVWADMKVHREFVKSSENINESVVQILYGAPISSSALEYL